MHHVYIVNEMFVQCQYNVQYCHEDKPRIHREAESSLYHSDNLLSGPNITQSHNIL